MLYRVAKTILGMMGYLKDVKLIVYNSDPFSRNPLPQFPLNINIVESVNGFRYPYIFRGNLSEFMPLKMRQREQSLENEINEFIAQINREAIGEDLLAFLGAFYAGLPLSLTTFFPDLEKIKGIIRRTVELFYKSIEVSEAEKLRITRRPTLHRISKHQSWLRLSP